MTDPTALINEVLAAIHKCQTDINAADVAQKGFNLPTSLHNTIHSDLAKASGDLNQSVTDLNAWLAANPPPAPAPTPPPPTPSPPPPTPSPNGPNAPVNVTGAPVFEDDFDGTSLDPTKWGPNWFGEGHNMNNVNCYKANVSVANSCVTLTLASTSSGALITTNPHNGGTPNPGFQFGNGYYVEWRAQIPGTAWAALWTDGQSWPADGETDIVEILDHGSPTSNYHATSVTNNGPDESKSYETGFHTFGYARKAGSNDVYWDGQLVRSYTTSDGGSPQYLIANIGQEGGEATPGSQLVVDYVRVWQLA